MHSRAAASVESKMATMQHKIFCAQKILCVDLLRIRAATDSNFGSEIGDLD